MTGAPRHPEPSPGFAGKQYERMRGDLLRYDDRFDDYWAFLEPRLAEAWRLLADDGTLYLHLDYREAHYAKVLLDALFGRECFLNEIDLGLRLRREGEATLADEARHDPRVREGPGAATGSTRPPSTASRTWRRGS